MLAHEVLFRGFIERSDCLDCLVHEFVAVRKVIAEDPRRPDRDIDVVVSDDRLGCNPKINNIANAYPLAKHGLLLLADSDIRVPRDFLRRCVAPLSDPRVGLVTCFYRCAETRGAAWGATAPSAGDGVAGRGAAGAASGLSAITVTARPRPAGRHRHLRPHPHRRRS